jgi:hypothetical protein
VRIAKRLSNLNRKDRRTERKKTRTTKAGQSANSAIILHWVILYYNPDLIVRMMKMNKQHERSFKTQPRTITMVGSLGFGRHVLSYQPLTRRQVHAPLPVGGSEEGGGATSQLLGT